MKPTDARAVSCTVYFLPVQTRMPLKFGSETVTSVVCARVKLTVEGRDGRRADGWGETPLSVQWVWPSSLPYDLRLARLKELCIRLCGAWASFDGWGHAFEVGHDFQEHVLRPMRDGEAEPMPWLAALICCSAFDLALHDAYGKLHDAPVYHTYTQQWMNRDLAWYFEDPQFRGQYPDTFLRPRQARLPVWHLVGGLDPLTREDLTGDEPQDGHPVLLKDWIQRDQLQCLKIKLRGNDAQWDYERLKRVGRIALEQDVRWLSADFNCTVQDPAYVNWVLDRLATEERRISDMLLYVEQPFPYELEEHRIDVHSVASRKPLFLDESAHNWRLIRLGRELGWSGVALKTCKTQTEALLSLCWARSHGMDLMVQDLTNPMLAIIPHALLAGHAGTIMGVEANAAQFYPDASIPESRVHPRLYQRREGILDLSSVHGAGFGYRLDEIQRALPAPAAVS